MIVVALKAEHFVRALGRKSFKLHIAADESPILLFTAMA